jgi:heterotetrameric sarcosine oxidase gamma subunit
MLKSTAPLGQLAGVRHTEGVTTESLTLTPVRDRAWLLLQGSPGRERLRTTLLREVGLLLPQPSRVLTSGARSILWLAPREWLLEVPGREQSVLQSVFGAELAQTLSVLTPLSDALAGFDISGTDAEELLASGCSLDLGPGGFDSGCVSRTLLADVPVILWRRGADQGYRCLVDRGLSHHLWSWLEEWRIDEDVMPA